MSPPVFTVLLMQEAANDIAEIGEYLSRNRSLEEALATIGKLTERIRSLAEFPLRGSVPLELAELGNHDHRQILISPYRAIYRVLDNNVFVMTVADGRRDMKALLRRRLLSS